MKFGYMRVSTLNQNLDRQKKQLEEFGCDRIFFEKVTGTKRNRPELNSMLEFLRSEDTVVVTDLTRLSRSTKDLIEITERISQKGAHLKSLKESRLDTTTAHGKMLFTIYRSQITTRDNLVEMFLQRMGIIHKKGKEELALLREQHRSISENLISVLSEVLETTAMHDDNTQIGSKITEIFEAKVV
ncbi:recombinase family protein [Bacillus cereus]|uniref:recombinase family protein n=1 Tax=Bacillus cereus TaxID=1396 RepID=UPI001F61E24E|nr:recombinase family protein [Bacillus cereus]